MFVMVDIKEVQYYDHHLKEMKHSQQHKAIQFIKNKCIVFDAKKNHYICKKIDGYNTRDYDLTRSGIYYDTMECNCQGWQMKLKRDQIIPGKPNCSHIGALYLFFTIQRINDGTFFQDDEVME
jgi:hypothetical protein